MSKISRQAYANMFGPTTGDRVRLGDTEIIIEVEKDLTNYGDEVKFGGGRSFAMAWAKAKPLQARWLIQLLPTR